MMCPVHTKVPGVKVQVWNSCMARIPGNFSSRNLFNNEISTLPERYFSDELEKSSVPKPGIVCRRMRQEFFKIGQEVVTRYDMERRATVGSTY